MTAGVLDGKVAIVTGAAMGMGAAADVEAMVRAAVERYGCLGGAIVNIGSVSSFRPQRDNAAYTAAKHGVIGLTKVASL
jgi:NAD(P)-dependent dehydrogenase (short-subunit alcohol dehydrogenase family)